jgi:hypothetical protein
MGKSLYVTDFDDTLALTDANVILIRNGETQELTPAEFAVYEPQKGDTFDFSQFDKLINPRPIQRFVKLLKAAVEGKKADKVVVLTARNHTLPVAQFLRMIGIESGVAIAALGNADPEKKARYIEKQIEDGFDRVLFVDDSPKNVAAVDRLKDKYPEVKLITHQVHPHEEPTGEPLQKAEPKTGESKNVEVRPIKKGDADYEQVDKWIRTEHYLKKWPKSVQSILGVYVDGKLSGTLVYGIGTRGQAATDIFETGTMANNQLWELQRAFTTEEAKKLVPNLGSMVISRGNEYIRTQARTKDGKPVKAIVSYADSAQGHGGSVYKASNATYLGEQPPRTGWAITDPNTGDTVTRTTIKKSVLQKMADEGFVIEKITPDTGKHKFLYVLGKDQNERDQLLAKITKPLFSYPKDGEPSRQIENPAKARVGRKPQQPIVKQQSNIAKIKQFLRGRMPTKDGGDIFIQTAYKDKNHPMHQQALRMVQGFAKKHGVRIK